MDSKYNTEKVKELSDEQKELLAKGKKYYEQEEFDLAYQCFEQLKDKYVVWEYLGEMYYSGWGVESNVDLAREYFYKLIEINQAWVDTFCNASLCTDDIEEKINLLNQAYLKGSDYAANEIGKLIEKYDVADHGTALEWYDRSIKQKKYNENRDLIKQIEDQISDLYIDKKGDFEIVSLYEKLDSYGYKKDAIDYKRLGVTYEVKGLYDEALEYYTLGVGEAEAEYNNAESVIKKAGKLGLYFSDIYKHILEESYNNSEELKVKADMLKNKYESLYDDLMQLYRNEKSLKDDIRDYISSEFYFNDGLSALSYMLDDISDFFFDTIEDFRIFLRALAGYIIEEFDQAHYLFLDKFVWVIYYLDVIGTLTEDIKDKEKVIVKLEKRAEYLLSNGNPDNESYDDYRYIISKLYESNGQPEKAFECLNTITEKDYKISDTISNYQKDGRSFLKNNYLLIFRLMNMEKVNKKIFLTDNYYLTNKNLAGLLVRYKLGRFYREGRVTTQDDKKAYSLYKECYDYMSEVYTEEITDVNTLRYVVGMELRDACVCMEYARRLELDAIEYKNKRGNQYDMKDSEVKSEMLVNAYILYKQAYIGGIKEAVYYMGKILYENEKGIKKIRDREMPFDKTVGEKMDIDINRYAEIMFDFFNRAKDTVISRKDNPNLYLYYLYNSGRGVEKDVDKAKMCLNKAAEAGCYEAIAILNTFIPSDQEDASIV